MTLYTTGFFVEFLLLPLISDDLTMKMMIMGRKMEQEKTNYS